MEYDVGGAKQIYFLPDITVCCGETMQEAIDSAKDVRTITTQGVMPFNGKVLKTHCKYCSKIYSFEGRKFGIVNFENRYMVDIGNVFILPKLCLQS